MYESWSAGIPGVGVVRVSVNAPSSRISVDRLSANSMRRSRARIDSKYSSNRLRSAALTYPARAVASASTASMTERLVAPPEGGRNMRSKMARGSISRVIGRSGADQEIAFRGNEFEKYPSPCTDNSSDGSRVSSRTCAAANWSADTPPALTPREL